MQYFPVFGSRSARIAYDARFITMCLEDIQTGVMVPIIKRTRCTNF